MYVTYESFYLLGQIKDKGVRRVYGEMVPPNGVSCWSELPLSPKLIVPFPLGPKHIEKESDATPALTNMFGTAMSAIASPIIPFTATSWNNPSWVSLHLPPFKYVLCMLITVRIFHI